jgi:hypothetical protein
MSGTRTRRELGTFAALVVVAARVAGGTASARLVAGSAALDARGGAAGSRAVRAVAAAVRGGRAVGTGAAASG